MTSTGSRIMFGRNCGTSPDNAPAATNAQVLRRLVRVHETEQRQEEQHGADRVRGLRRRVDRVEGKDRRDPGGERRDAAAHGRPRQPIEQHGTSALITTCAVTAAHGLFGK